MTDELDEGYNLATLIGDLRRISHDRASEALPNPEAQGHASDLNMAIAYLERDLFGFTFDGEAGESFQTLCDKLVGWTVRVTTEDGEEFDAMVVGADRESEWVNDVVVRLLDENREPASERLTFTVRNIHVY